MQPNAAFSVQWTAEMIFACLIGGIGTIEGPIVGTIVFFVLQQWLSNYGDLVLHRARRGRHRRRHLGARAACGACSPSGSDIRLFPVGYWLWPADQQARPGLGRLPARRGGGESGT